MRLLKALGLIALVSAVVGFCPSPAWGWQFTSSPYGVRWERSGDDSQTIYMRCTTYYGYRGGSAATTVTYAPQSPGSYVSNRSVVLGTNMSGFVPVYETDGRFQLVQFFSDTPSYSWGWVFVDTSPADVVVVSGTVPVSVASTVCASVAGTVAVSVMPTVAAGGSAPSTVSLDASSVVPVDLRSFSDVGSMVPSAIGLAAIGIGFGLGHRGWKA